MLILFAVIAASAAALTGILAVGSGKHWKFKCFDYFRGKRNAILYMWVAISTIFSITHAGFLIDFGVRTNWTIDSDYTLANAIIHTVMAVLLILAHLFVAMTLSKEVGPVDKFLWGKRNVVP